MESIQSDYSVELLINSVIISTDVREVLDTIVCAYDYLQGINNDSNFAADDFINENAILRVNLLNNVYQQSAMNSCSVLNCLKIHQLELSARACELIRLAPNKCIRETYTRCILSQLLSAVVHVAFMDNSNTDCVSYCLMTDDLWKLTAYLSSVNDWNACSMVLSITIKFLVDLMNGKVEVQQSKKTKLVQNSKSANPLSFGMLNQFKSLIHIESYYDTICSMLLHSNPVIRKRGIYILESTVYLVSSEAAFASELHIGDTAISGWYKDGAGKGKHWSQWYLEIYHQINESTSLHLIEQMWSHMEQLFGLIYIYDKWRTVEVSDTSTGIGECGRYF